MTGLHNCIQSYNQFSENPLVLVMITFLLYELMNYKPTLSAMLFCFLFSTCLVISPDVIKPESQVSLINI